VAGSPPRTDDYTYDLPPALIAQRPLPARDASRLLVLHRDDGRVEHRRFPDLADYLREPDVLVLNETRVLAARLAGTLRRTGRPVETLLVRPGTEENVWLAMLKPGRRARAGDFIEFERGVGVEVLDDRAEESGLRSVRWTGGRPAAEVMEARGATPLPPYIRRPADAGDRDRYQTVFARVPGAVAAPTAGLHFTQEFLARIESRGIAVVRGLLHVAPGTFRPVTVEDPRLHPLDPERFEWTEEAAREVNGRIARGGRVVAVGTTVARLLETVAAPQGREVRVGSGWTDLFILPPHRFRVVDLLLTNFHLPRSTLLMLVAAFAGREPVLRAYAEAVREGYRFYSYGDAMLVL
jgi:S-adenosylmethionine:tRNA ribosyltransferase-isomerase